MIKEKAIFRTNIVLFVIFAFLITGCQHAAEITPPATENPTELAALPLTGKGPSMVVRDQASDGKSINVDEVTSEGPGWLVIHNQENGQPGQVIGFAPLKEGLNKNVQIKIDPGLATDVMYAVLHVDAGRIGTYEFPGADEPVQANGQVVSTLFLVNKGIERALTTVTQVLGEASTATPGPVVTQPSPEAVTPAPVTGLAPAVKIVDQAVKNGAVVIEEAISTGPGWLVVYSEQDGQLKDVIGYAPVRDGMNNNVIVKVDTSKVTPELYAVLHTDAGHVGTFEYPGSDVPVVSETRIVLDRFSTGGQDTASNTPESKGTVHVVAMNQPLRGGTIKVAEAYSDGPGWIGVHLVYPDGKIGSAIGSGLLKDGDNRDVIIKVDTPRATGVMIAMIHYDRGKLGVWEYPGPDAPVMINNEMVMMNFKVTGGLKGQDVILNVAENGGKPYLVDGQGLSLYTSLTDEPGFSRCDAQCHQSWLPLLVTTRLIAGEGVAGDKLGVIFLVGGAKQATYNGLPLYYYAGDDNPGDTKGQGVDGKWFLSTP